MRRRLFATVAFSGVTLSSMAAAQTAPPFPSRTAHHVRTIGEGTNDALGQVSSLLLDARGNIYVLDAMAAEIVVLDSMGRRVRSISRSGGGPGELQQPWLMRLHRDTLYVSDDAAGEHRFSADGKWLGTTRPSELKAHRYGLRHGLSLEFVDPLPTGRLSYLETPQSSPYVRRLVLHNARGARDTVMSWRTDHVVTANGLRRELTSSGFGDEAAWALHGDSLLTIANGYTSVVRTWRTSPSGLTRVFTDSLRVRARPVTPEDVRTAEKRASQATFTISFTSPTEPGRYGASPVARFAGTPELMSEATRVLMSNNGDVWVSRARAELVNETSGGRLSSKMSVRDNVWTVFPKGGSPYVVTLPSDRILSGVRGNTLVLRDTEDAFVIHVMVVR